MKKCCFIGHRKINITKSLVEKFTELLCNLIEINKVTIFLFGSKSDFNNLAYEVVKSLKSKYSNIKMIVYTCKNETNISEDKLQSHNAILNKVSHKNIKLFSYDEEIDFKTKYETRKNSYIDRNKAMIDASDYCVFYYDEKQSQENYTKTHKNSGTKLSFDYAKSKNKILINILN